MVNVMLNFYPFINMDWDVELLCFSSPSLFLTQVTLSRNSCDRLVSCLFPHVDMGRASWSSVSCPVLVRTVAQTLCEVTLRVEADTWVQPRSYVVKVCPSAICQAPEDSVQFTSGSIVC